MDSNDTQAVEEQAPVQDTATTQQSEASESSQEAPEVTQETTTQEVEETEVSAEETAEKLYAGKYKTVEELEKAYKNAESKIGKEASKRAELSRAVNESLAQTTSTDDDLVGRKMAAMEFIISHPDADPQSIRDVLTSDPLVENIVGYEARLEYAYLRSQTVAKEEAVAKATEEAQVKAQAKIVEKQGAQVETARRTEPVDEDADLVSKATKGSPDEREAARIALIRKHLVNL